MEVFETFWDILGRFGGELGRVQTYLQVFWDILGRFGRLGIFWDVL